MNKPNLRIRLEMLRLIMTKRNVVLTYKDKTGIWQCYDCESDRIWEEMS